jgi:hypothetical protein
MNQMTVEVVQIVGLGRSCIARSILAEIAKNMRCMMIDNDDHSARLNESAGGRYQPRLFKQFSESRYLINPELGAVRPLENIALRSDQEGEFIPSQLLNLA